MAIKISREIHLIYCEKHDTYSEDTCPACEYDRGYDEGFGKGYADGYKDAENERVSDDCR